jgi:hypothetical protein
MCAYLLSGTDMRLSRRANGDTMVFILTNLIAYATNGNSKNGGRPCAVSMIMYECVENELPFDLPDRVTDKVRSCFTQCKFMRF